MRKDWHESLSQPEYDILLEEDVWVPMRDGVELATDIYRPDAPGKFPVLISFSAFGKDQQKLPTHPEYQPSDILRGTGGHECGEQSYFVPRGYIQIIPDIRGVGKSSGDFGLSFVSGKGLVEQSAGAVIGNLVQWVLGIVGVLLLIMLIYGGILYMISGGNEDQIGTAKKVLTYAMFGVVIIAIAFALTRAIINALLGA